MKKAALYIFTLILLSINTSTLKAQTPTTNQNNKQQSTLKILSWNIYMLPALVIGKGKKKRAKKIAGLLAQSHYDIIVFQEAFHKKARNILAKGLIEKFPYQFGPINKGKFLKSNSGVWIVSKIPLNLLASVQFKNCKNADCFSKKGAILLEGKKDGQAFQIVGTHLQADYPKKENQAIRLQQYEAINKELLLPFQKKNVPQIIAGDLNTQKQKTKDYQNMLNTFSATDGEISENHTYISDDFATKKNQTKVVYDYILYKANGKTPANIERSVKKFRTKWKKGKSDLSDHYAVEAIIKW